ncbi:MAG TPA: hypothetical protein VGI74_06010 [Streptosporangiaceae bacterium]
MSLRRLWITALAAAPLLVIPLATAGPAWAAAHASGKVTCFIQSGSGTLSPGLTPAGSAGSVKINFNGKFVTGQCSSAVTKPKGDQVTGGTFTGTGFYDAPPAGGPGSSCANFDGPDVVGRITVTIHWTTTGTPITPTAISYASNPGTVSGSPTDTIVLNAPPGTATKSGSFGSATTPAITKMVTNLPGPTCGAGPFGTFSITGGDVNV